MKLRNQSCQLILGHYSQLPILKDYDACEHIFKAPIYNNLHLIERELSFYGMQQILS